MGQIGDGMPLDLIKKREDIKRKRRGREAELEMRQLKNTAKNTAHNARCVRF
jgi:hypothetical protein